MRHPDDGTLQALADGEIPSADLSPLADHLAACEECRARLELVRVTTAQADDLVSSLGDGAPSATAPTATPLPPGPAIRRPVPIRRLAWAATIALSAGLGYWARGAPARPETMLAVEAPGRETAELAPAEIATPVPAPSTVPSSPDTPGGSAGRSPSGTGAPPPAAGAPAPPTLVPPAAEPEAAKTVPMRTNALARQGAGAEPLAERRLAAAPMALADRSEAIIESFRPIEFAEAIARLGGTIRLVDGLVPVRLEASTAVVRVVYPLEAGELVLEQRRAGDSIAVALRGPVSAESLAVLRRRIR